MFPLFCIFSREIVADLREADLEVLEMFNPETIDVLVFTSYPHAVSEVNSPEDIPNDYYKKAFNYFPDKAFGFSEVAWSSLEAFGGEQGQAEAEQIQDHSELLVVQSDSGILGSWNSEICFPSLQTPLEVTINRPEPASSLNEVCFCISPEPTPSRLPAAGHHPLPSCALAS